MRHIFGYLATKLATKRRMKVDKYNTIDDFNMNNCEATSSNECLLEQCRQTRPKSRYSNRVHNENVDFNGNEIMCETSLTISTASSILPIFPQQLDEEPVNYLKCFSNILCNYFNHLQLMVFVN
jgi:hypothetical protein